MRAGEPIGCYRVVRLLGQGGMSEVYEVENARLGSRHALKLFTYEKDDPEVRERFLLEGRLLARLQHPRIVKVTDFGTDETGGRPYFVMDLIRNGRGEVQSLADVQPGTVDEDGVGKWYDDLRAGLAYIHANGVIHRDLKLQNVLIGPDGHAVLTDFGISKVFDAKGDGAKIVDTVNTIVKMREGRSLVMGSIGYMAPELEMGVAASPQSDWYALGVIAYRLLTGTWCDARTDVASTLETYDPVWKRILPKLLHSNPNGRACPSYGEEKAADRIKAEVDWEDRWLKEKSRGHLARHLARYGFVLCILLCGGLVWLKLHFEQVRKADWAVRSDLERQLAIPAFVDVCRVPPAERSDQGLPWGRSRREAALIDAWVLTHGLFDDLRAGKITLAKAIGEMEALSKTANENWLGLFDSVKGYSPVGDMHALSRILSTAVEEMRRRLPAGIAK